MKLKDIYRKALSELLVIDPLIIADVSVDIYDETAVKEDFQEFFPAARIEKDPLRALAEVTHAILLNKPGWHKLFSKIVQRVRHYVESTNYLDMSDERLRHEFEKDLPVAILHRGITPQLLIFYLIACQRQYRHPRLPFLIEEYRRMKEKAQSFAPEQVLTLEEGESLIEKQLALFLADHFMPKDDDLIAETCKKYGGEYDPSTRTVRVPRGLVMFVESALALLKEREEHVRNVGNFLFEEAPRLYMMIARAGEVYRKNEELTERMKRLEERLRKLEEEKRTLEQKLETQPLEDLKRENIRLKKELAEAEKRISYLQNRLAELEEEKEIIPEISENVEIAPEKPVLRTVRIEPFSTVIVSGGRYSSKDEQELEKLLEPLGCDIRFIPAEETLRYTDAFKAADVIFFDTSRHAHRFFYKLRSLNARIVLVRGKGELKELLARSTKIGGEG